VLQAEEEGVSEKARDEEKKKGKYTSWRVSEVDEDERTPCPACLYSREACSSGEKRRVAARQADGRERREAKKKGEGGDMRRKGETTPRARTS